MKFFHLSDLHLGKRVLGFSMLEDQRLVLRKILAAAKEERPDACLIAGDVYDKAVPSAEAVELLDDFLSSLAGLVPHVFVISGNHDSPERIAFGGRLMERGGVHMSPVFNGVPEPVILRDAYGDTAVYSLPFIKPAHVRRAFSIEDREGMTYSEAFGLVVSAMAPDPSRRNILIAHQLVIGGERSDSEEISIGGTDGIDAGVFAPFDYVALGHLHRPQRAGTNGRYCGTPLPYSFSEASDHKSVTVVELGEKGKDPVIREIPLVPERPFLRLRGSYMELASKRFYEDLNREAYVEITLTDETDVPNAMGKLRVLYPNLMKLQYDNTRPRNVQTVQAGTPLKALDPVELMGDFFRKVNGRDLTEAERAYLSEKLMQIRAGKEEA